MNHCKTIAIVNQKGGVGKTTSTVNLGVGLAQAGNRVLLVDDDPQHSLTISLGIRNADDDLDTTLATAMQAEIRDESVPWEEGIIHSDEGVDLLPANIELSGVEMSLFNAMSREQVLKSVLSRVKENYDYILIDCMPSLGLMSINALVAADSVIIPSAPDFLSTKGLNLLIHTISRVRRQINPKLKIDGILMTMVDGRTNNAKSIIAALRSTLGGSVRVFDTEIPRSVRAAEASGEGNFTAKQTEDYVIKALEACPNARTAIKFLVEDGRFDYIESGSLLGVRHKEVRSYPVGFEELYQMYPMDLEEYLWANGVQKSTIQYLKDCYETGTPVTDAIHQAMCKLLYSYIVVGGMPDVVQTYVNTHDIAQVIARQTEILELYRLDIAQYTQGSKKVKARAIFDSIPSQLNDKKRRFVLAALDPNGRQLRYADSFNWLADAGVALPCYNVEEPQPPLMLNEKRSLFKLFMADTGLLCAACMENVQFEILNGALQINMGSILENMIAQQLKCNGFQLNYYDGKKTGEIDFVILTIDCEEVENHYDVTNGQMADLDWLLYNATMEYASLVLSGEMEYYLKGPALHGIED